MQFTNAAENVRDIFIMNIKESDCQRELSRSTKTPEEVYRIALSYERGDKAYESYMGKRAESAPYINIKQEQVGNIRRETGCFRNRGSGGRGTGQRGSNTRKCYKCDAPNFNFTMERINVCSA